jgi:hypothetical protein
MRGVLQFFVAMGKARTLWESIFLVELQSATKNRKSTTKNRKSATKSV